MLKTLCDRHCRKPLRDGRPGPRTTPPSCPPTCLHLPHLPLAHLGPSPSELLSPAGTHPPPFAPSGSPRCWPFCLEWPIPGPAMGRRRLPLRAGAGAPLASLSAGHVSVLRVSSAFPLRHLLPCVAPGAGGSWTGRCNGTHSSL